MSRSFYKHFVLRGRRNDTSVGVMMAMAAGILLFLLLTRVWSVGPESTIAQVENGSPEMAVLTINNRRTITVNGIIAASGATIFSGNTLEIPAKVSATVNAGRSGLIEAASETNMTVGFTTSSLSVVLSKGCAVLETSKGTTGEIRTTQGALMQTDPGNGGKVSLCATENATVQKPPTAIHNSLFNLAKAAAFAIVGGEMGANESLTQVKRGNNPGPSAP